MKKIIALMIITIVLSSIPLVAATNSKPPISKAVFIHRADGYVKPPGVGKPKPEPEEPQLYDFMLKNIKWQALGLSYVINPTINAAANKYNLENTEIATTISLAAETWDNESFTTVNHFGSYAIDYTAEVDFETAQVDEVNEIVFGDFPYEGAIAVCIVYFISVGPPSGRRIVEFDIIFDDVDFVWGNAGETNENIPGDTTVMDIQNIATHELGHALGLDDLYFSEASEQTMFGVGAYGETKKRTLNTGDIDGIVALYG